MQLERIGNRAGRPLCAVRPVKWIPHGASLLLALAALSSPAAAAAAAPNVCHITGITRAVARSVFPKLYGFGSSQSAAATNPPNFGTCAITPNSSVASLEVELWSASVFAQQSIAFKNDGPLQKLSGLGPGAFYSSVRGIKNDANVLFQRGAYTVLIDTSRIGGTSRDYPTEKQYLTLARAVYRHL